MLKFVAQDSNGLPRKRKHAGNACENCRKRKKRCRHHQLAEETTLTSALLQQLSARAASGNQGIDDSLDDSSPSTSDLDMSIRRSGQGQGNAYSTSFREDMPLMPAPANLAVDARPRSSHNQSSQRPSNTSVTHAFVHGSPASVTNTVTSRSHEVGDESRFVGDLNPEAAFLAATVSPVSPQNDVGVWSTRNTGEPNSAFIADTQRVNRASSLLLLNDTKIANLLLPYLQHQCIQLMPNAQSFDALSTIYFAEVDPIFPILDKSSTWMYPDQTPAKVLLKQAVCLAASTSPRARKHLSLGTSDELSYREFSNQLVRAVNTSIALGLVTERVVSLQVMALMSLFSQFSDDRESSADWHSRAVSLGHDVGIHLLSHGERTDQLYRTRLFCCLWALDRLNAACHGRPTLMHHRDFGHNVAEVFAQQESGFYLFLRVVLLLDQVIALYRPADSRKPEDKFPSFEELVLITGAVRVASPLLATVESLYHAVAMLSCRTGETESESSGAAQGRHNLSAVKLTMIVGDEFHHQLSFFPWVPYALSLSLRAAYRDLRHSKAPMFRTRARKQLLTNCDLLRDLSVVFPSAKNMVELAEQVIREMDRVYLTISSAQQNDVSAGQVVPSISEGFLGTLSETHNAELLQQRCTVNNTNEGNSTSHHPVVADDSNLLFDYDPNTFDPSIFEKLPDLDVFEHFDPGFDLEAFDATLGETVDLSLPYNLTEFMH